MFQISGTKIELDANFMEQTHILAFIECGN
jgi:hypothetical protein